MHLHWGWAALAALALGAGLAWWAQPVAQRHASPDDPHRPDATHRTHAHADADPTLYRWMDARGVVNFTTEHPPAGRKFTIMHIDPNRNIVPMSGNDSASKATSKPH